MKKYLLILLTIFTINSCEELEDTLLANNSVPDTNQLVLGKFTGTGDLFRYYDNLDLDSWPVLISVKKNGDSFSVNVWFSNGPTSSWSNETFETKNGNVDYKNSNKHFKGSVSLGQNINSGSIKVYKMNTNGSENIYKDMVWTANR